MGVYRVEPCTSGNELHLGVDFTGAGSSTDITRSSNFGTQLLLAITLPSLQSPKNLGISFFVCRIGIGGSPISPVASCARFPPAQGEDHSHTFDAMGYGVYITEYSV